MKEQRKKSPDDFMITTKFSSIPKCLFDKPEPKKYEVMNKFTGDKFGPFDSITAAQTFVRNLCAE